MKRFNIVKNPTTFLGKDLPFNSVYGTVLCDITFVDWEIRQHKDGTKYTQKVTIKSKMRVSYNIINTTPRLENGHVFYEMYIYTDKVKSWRKITDYDRRYVPIYDLVYDITHDRNMKRATPHITHKNNGAPREKKAQVDFDYRNRNMGYADNNRVVTDSDPTAKFRPFVIHSGFAR